MTKEEAVNDTEAPAKRRKLIRRVVSSRPRFLPPEFHEHTRAARKEALLAMRSLIDARIERLDQAAEEKPKPKTHRVKVE